jgi:DNA-directed RNA polymerase subunit RPC12/RpoP
MPKSEDRTAYAVSECSECGFEYHVTVPVVPGENEYDVRCPACRHINFTRELTGA